MIELKPYVTVETPDLPATVVAHVEELDGKLFWIELFPEGQQHAHRVRYDQLSNLPQGRAYYQNGKMVAYVTSIEESHLPGWDPPLAIANWEEYLKERRNQREFEYFIEKERKI